MKKLNLIAICLILPLLVISCKNKIDSRYIEEPIAIDGVYGDWNHQILAIDKTEAGLGVTHNDSDLFVCLVTADRDLRQQIVRNGLKVYISAEKKSKYAMGINFPLGMEMPQGGPRGQRRERGSSQPKFDRNSNQHSGQFDRSQGFGQMDMVQEIQATEFKLIYNKVDISIVSFFNNPYDIELKVKPSQNNIVYELKVPLAEIPGYSDETEIIKLGIELAESKMPGGRPGGGMDGGPGGGGGMPPGGGSGGGMGGGPGGSGGGMGGGPGGGGPGGGPGSDMQQSSSSQLKVWFDISINQNK